MQKLNRSTPDIKIFGCLYQYDRSSVYAQAVRYKHKANTGEVNITYCGEWVNLRLYLRKNALIQSIFIPWSVFWMNFEFYRQLPHSKLLQIGNRIALYFHLLYAHWKSCYTLLLHGLIDLTRRLNCLFSHPAFTLEVWTFLYPYIFYWSCSLFVVQVRWLVSIWNATLGWNWRKCLFYAPLAVQNKVIKWALLGD